ncbi:MAG: RagB/SusD family nutrient uptake outer membrane protein, partial [Bacteroidota bacterium]
MKNNIFILITISVLTFFGTACTDLEELVIDESLTGAGQAEAVSGAIVPAYGQVSWVWRHTNYYGLQLIAADEGILPYRGGTDWFDGGKFLATHQHLMTSGNDLVRSSWNELTKNISRAISAIEILRPLSEEGNTEATGALYEM